MKKLFTLLLAASLTWTVSAEFISLKFTSLSGESTVLSVDGLSLSVADGNLVVNNADGDYTLPLADLATMEFSNEQPSAGVGAVAASQSEGKTVVYSVDGRLCGAFSGDRNLASVLPAGIYIARQQDGTTSKIVVR